MCTLHRPEGQPFKIISPEFLHIADRSFFLLPFAVQTDLETAAKPIWSADDRNNWLAGLRDEHSQPAKNGILSARDQLVKAWNVWIAEQYGDDEGGGGGGGGGAVGGSGDSGGARCTTPTLDSA